MFVKTLDILTALQTTIVAIHLPSSYSGVPDYPKAFTEVKIYRDQNLIKAFADMLVFDDRACFIVPAGDRDTDHTEGRVTIVDRETDLVLLIADRNYGGEDTALVGEAGAGPGVVALKDLVTEKLTGARLNLPYVLLVSNGGQPMHLTDTEKEAQAGRDCWALDFKTSAGSMRVARDR
jgi:hypothetical protein